MDDLRRLLGCCGSLAGCCGENKTGEEAFTAWLYQLKAELENTLLPSRPTHQHSKKGILPAPAG